MNFMFKLGSHPPISFIMYMQIFQNLKLHNSKHLCAQAFWIRDNRPGTEPKVSGIHWYSWSISWADKEGRETSVIQLLWVYFKKIRHINKSYKLRKSYKLKVL